MMNALSRVNLKEHKHSGFHRGAGKIRELTWYVCNVLFFLTPVPFPSLFKTLLLRFFGADVGERVIIRPKVNIRMPWKLTVGNDCWIGDEVLILNFDTVYIGSNVCISQRAFVCAGNHDYKDPSMPFRYGTVSIKDGAWICAMVFIGPGSEVGTDCVVSAGSVVCGKLKDNAIYKGNPAVYSQDRWK